LETTNLVKLDEAEYPVKLDEAEVPVTLEEEAYPVGVVMLSTFGYEHSPPPH